MNCLAMPVLYSDFFCNSEKPYYTVTYNKSDYSEKIKIDNSVSITQMMNDYYNYAYNCLQKLVNVSKVKEDVDSKAISINKDVVNDCIVFLNQASTSETILPDIDWEKDTGYITFFWGNSTNKSMLNLLIKGNGNIIYCGAFGDGEYQDGIVKVEKAYENLSNFFDKHFRKDIQRKEITR